MAVTLAEIVLDAKDRADLLNNTLVNDVTWRRWANQATERLYGNLVVKAPGRFHRSTSFTLSGVGGNDAILAADFRQLREQGITKNPTSQSGRYSLRRFNFAARDAQGQMPPWGAGRELAYDIRGGLIVVEPASLCAGSYSYSYLAGPVKWLTDGSQDSVAIATVFEPYVDFIADLMAIKGLIKEESLDTAQSIKTDAGARLEEILAEFNDTSDPATIIDVDETGGGYYR